jgi:predicted SprT family Zn-dependent metalloprotease
MKPTITKMQTWFDEFNKAVFEGKLPKVPIKFNNTYRQLGQFYWGATRGIGIKISLYYDRTEEQYRNCLLHEMCHLYCYHKGWVHEGHGPRWKAIANKAYRITGLYIQRCENARDWKVADKNKAHAAARKEKKNAPAIIVDIDYGVYHFIVKTTKKVIWDASDGNVIKGKNVSGVYICDDKRALAWQNSRSLNRGYKFHNWEYEREIAPMLKKAKKVSDLRKLCWWGEYDNLGVR